MERVEQLVARMVRLGNRSISHQAADGGARFKASVGPEHLQERDPNLGPPDPWHRKTGHFPKGDFGDPPQSVAWGQWKRALARWNVNTDVPMWRRAEKVLRQFSWEFQTHFDHLSEEQLSGSRYLEHIAAVLDTLAGERSSSEKDERSEQLSTRALVDLTRAWRSMRFVARPSLPMPTCS